MATIGSLAVSLTAKSDGFNRAMDNAGKKSKAFGKTVGKLKGVVAGLATALGGMAIARSIGKAFGDLDKVAKFSDEIGLATETISAFQLGAELTGTKVESLNKGMQIFVRRLGEAKSGTGEGLKGLRALGIAAEDIVNVSADEAFLRISDGIASIGTQAERAAAAYSLFGRQGQDLLNFLQGGRAQLEGFIKEAEGLGIAFNRTDLRKIEAANDAIVRLKTVASGAAQTIAIELSDSIVGLADALRDAAPALKATSVLLAEAGGSVVTTGVKNWKTLAGVYALVKVRSFALAKSLDAVAVAAERAIIIIGVIKSLAFAADQLTKPNADTVGAGMVDSVNDFARQLVGFDKWAAARENEHQANIAAYLETQAAEDNLRKTAEARVAAQEKITQKLREQAAAIQAANFKQLDDIWNSIADRIAAVTFGPMKLLEMQARRLGASSTEISKLLQNAQMADMLDAGASSIKSMADELNSLRGIDPFDTLITKLKTFYDTLDGETKGKIGGLILRLKNLRFALDVAREREDFDARFSAFNDKITARGGIASLGAATRGSVAAVGAERQARGGLKTLEQILRESRDLDKERNDLLRRERAASDIQPVTIMG